MLTDISIKNLAIIDTLTISFENGFNVITGETGSGKSIILHAIELILGAKPSIDLIRSGSETAQIEAHFDLSVIPKEIFNSLPDIAQEDELVLTRVINKNGRGKIFINGCLGTASLLEDISSKLINVCQQDQHVKLLDSKYHIELIDDYAGNISLLQQYQENFKAWQSLQNKIVEIENRLKTDALRQIELTNIVEDLKPLSLKPGLRSELENEVKKLSNAERIISSCNSIINFYEDENEGLGLALDKISSLLLELHKLDENSKNLLDGFHVAQSEIQELITDVHHYVSNVSIDQSSLEKLRDRLAEIARVERKYRSNDQGLIAILENAERELSLIEEGSNLDALKNQLVEATNDLRELSNQLTKSRQKAGLALAKEVQKELKELNMNAELQVAIEKTDFTNKGCDKVEILISPNKGEELKPLRKIASGGELSRIMLVLKKILREKSGVNVLVFDEVDTGVSGSVARAVGEKLKTLAQFSQVLCITHLAQVASLADHHYQVRKEVSDERTNAKIIKLDFDARVNEVARLLAGHKITPAAKESAKELING